MERKPARIISRPLVVLLSLAAVLVVIAILVAPTINGMSAKDKTDNVLLTGVPFILIFVAIVLAFISFIAVVAARFNDRISPRAHAIGEALIIGGIVVGIIGTFQPWTIAGYQIGFHLLLLCMLAFNVWSHVIPRRERRGEAH
jgi:nitrate/nitrite transporter NarK